MYIRREIPIRETKKRGLANLHRHPLYQTRQAQGIAYASLVTNALLFGYILWIWL